MTRIPFRRAFALGLLVLSLATPAAAISPGSPEAYMRDGHSSYAAGYWSGASTSFRQATMLAPDNGEAHFMLAASLAKDGRWDEARDSFARAVELRAELRGDADAWLAAAPGAAPPSTAPRPAPTPGPSPAPAPAPAPAPEPAPGDAAMFAVGDRVEVMYREGFWIPGVVTAADYPGPCPYYNVRADAYGNGNPSVLGYGCKTVRAPTGVAPVVAECGGSNPNCPPTSPPPAGAYGCTEQVWQGPGANPQYRPRMHGTIVLMAGGRYRHRDGGEVGGYRYDPASHRLAWDGGDLDVPAAVATYGLDGSTPEITIEFPGGGTRWQCGLQR